MKRITVDAERCAGCRYCELACSGRHYHLFSTSLSRVTVVKDDHRGLDYPVLCHQCDECIPEESCPVGAIKRTGGCIVVDETCVGCGQCVELCKFGAIKLVDSRPIACDLCGGDPECVKRCPTGALLYGEYDGGYRSVKDELNELQRRLGIVG
ncbi:4Fe-4S dicluster domain-containing protein [Candidatus Bathyarchaeota archaeon]|nr:4Fe-4S dicluster domain-containing protein [Candidatus Bathyarchaeota archaeon]